MAVGYAGLKDRHAVTRQSFSRAPAGHAPIRTGRALAIPGVRVLAASRHDRKLKRGVHRGNRFRIRVREVAAIAKRSSSASRSIRERGVPNYFGEQRFGRDAGNVAQRARAVRRHGACRAHESGLAISAARSLLFNAVLATRVADGSWDSALDGDVWMLDGHASIFGPEPWTIELARRLAAFDIDPTGPMIGAGELRSCGRVRAIEQQCDRAVPRSRRGLARRRSRASNDARCACAVRRARPCMGSRRRRWSSNSACRAGAFATVVLRELCGGGRQGRPEAAEAAGNRDGWRFSGARRVYSGRRRRVRSSRDAAFRNCGGHDENASYRMQQSSLCLAVSACAGTGGSNGMARGRLAWTTTFDDGKVVAVNQWAVHRHATVVWVNYPKKPAHPKDTAAELTADVVRRGQQHDHRACPALRGSRRGVGEHVLAPRAAASAVMRFSTGPSRTRAQALAVHDAHAVVRRARSQSSRNIAHRVARDRAGSSRAGRARRAR